MSELRLTTGEFRGRVIRHPKHARPTLGKIRQAIINSIQHQIVGAKVLELFAGSGALGFELLSCGAEHVTFVEQDPEACRLIQANSDVLGVKDQVTLIRGMISKKFLETQWATLPNSSPPFDLIVLDPPYDDGYTSLLDHVGWQRVLKPGGLLIFEASKRETIPNSIPLLRNIRDRTYGDTRVLNFVLNLAE